MSGHHCSLFFLSNTPLLTPVLYSIKRQCHADTVSLLFQYENKSITKISVLLGTNSKSGYLRVFVCFVYCHQIFRSSEKLPNQMNFMTLCKQNPKFTKSTNTSENTL